MPSIDVTSAPDRFLTMSVDGYAPGRNRPGNCARWTYFALPTIPNTTPLPSAIAAWNNAPLEHRHAIIDGHTRIPRGMVIALGAVSRPRWPGDVNYPYGDVFIATGEGVGYDSVGIATDSLAGTGIIGRITIRQRISQTGRPLLGFLSSYGGWNLTTKAQTVKPSPSKPIAQEEPMASQPVVYTDGKRYVGGDEVAGLFTFSNSKQLAAWNKNSPIVRKVDAGTIDKLARKANA